MGINSVLKKITPLNIFSLLMMRSPIETAATLIITGILSALFVYCSKNEDDTITAREGNINKDPSNTNDDSDIEDWVEIGMKTEISNIEK
ncbi:16182_t:CDS:2 [Funneliformis mosseae]|uniref:16182_t:CDS:1 n=1 Tax=Funneliformis mosseae TaxID=27381 RepID=A0A9N9BHK0_FUNMO|nr:16182_t:CDS:2 [Funneliformis mosseae]